MNRLVMTLCLACGMLLHAAAPPGARAEEPIKGAGDILQLLIPASGYAGT